MYGAVIGDIIGEPYEFIGGPKTKEFKLFKEHPTFTDDSIMTVAVAEALIRSKDKNDDKTKKELVCCMQKWGALYPDAGYGGSFWVWLHSDRPEPYNSYGNGSAMRASAAGWLAGTLEEALRLGELSACVTHNHPEGIKGAQATAAAIFIGRQRNKSIEERKAEIRSYITEKFGYDLNRTYESIRPTYQYEISCQKTVPEAIVCVLGSTSFEDAVRSAVDLGGDADTIGAIAGSIAEALYGMPKVLIEIAQGTVDKNMKSILDSIETPIDDKTPVTLSGKVVIQETVPATGGPDVNQLIDILRDLGHYGDTKYAMEWVDHLCSKGGAYPEVGEEEKESIKKAICDKMRPTSRK